MDDQTITFKINAPTLFLIHIILQQNGHPDITEDQTCDLVLKAIDSMKDEE